MDSVIVYTDLPDWVTYVHFYPRDIRVAFTDATIMDLQQGSLALIAREHIESEEKRMGKELASGSTLVLRKE